MQQGATSKIPMTKFLLHQFALIFEARYKTRTNEKAIDSLSKKKKSSSIPIFIVLHYDVNTDVKCKHFKSQDTDKCFQNKIDNKIQVDPNMLQDYTYHD